MRSAATRGRGFSLVEMLLVVLLTSIGFIALINLQMGTLSAVSATRHMTGAVNLAEHTIETIRTEALEWTQGGGSQITSPVAFPLLYAVGAPKDQGTSGWVPATPFLSQDTDKRVGQMGAYAAMDAGIHNEFPPDAQKRYCVHYRLTWLIPEWLIRADVRVSWMRDKSNLSLYRACDVGMAADTANVGSVTLPATIMRNVFFHEDAAP